MRARAALQKCLSECLGRMHAARCAVLLQAVQALVAGHRLTLIDVARSWPGAERVRAPLKAFDRLLNNRHLHGEREQLYEAMARWLPRGEILLLVSALAAFACWLAGLASEALWLDRWFSPHRATRRLYSVLRAGREGLVRRWPLERVTRWLSRLRTLPDAALEPMQAPA